MPSCTSLLFTSGTFVALVAIITAFATPSFQVHATGGIVVSGASTGIGKHAALYLAKNGYTVFAGVRKQTDVDVLLAAEVDPSKKGKLVPVLLDVTEEESVSACVQQIKEHLKKDNLHLIGLVNNAGVSKDLPMEVQTEANVRYVYEVNVFGVYRMYRHFMPLLREAGSGARIVNIGSVAGIVTNLGAGTYSGTKFAVEAITDASRLELQKWGISVSVVNPAYVKTEIGNKSLGKKAPPKTLSKDHYKMYEHIFDGAERKREKNFAKADTCDVTTAAIAHAITNPRPQHRYLVAKVGVMPAFVVAFLKWFLPTRAMDWIILNPPV